MALFVSPSLGKSAPSDDFFNWIPGAPPSRNITHWVRLVVIGNTFDSAKPIVWLSPQSFYRRGPDQL